MDVFEGRWKGRYNYKLKIVGKAAVVRAIKCCWGSKKMVVVVEWVGEACVAVMEWIGRGERVFEEYGWFSEIVNYWRSVGQGGRGDE